MARDGARRKGWGRTAARAGLWTGVAAAALGVASISTDRTWDAILGAGAAASSGGGLGGSLAVGGSAGSWGELGRLGRLGRLERLERLEGTERLEGADGVGEGASEAERLLREAIVRLEGLRSLSADLNFEANFFGERYFGRGRYEETSEATGGGAARRSTLENVRYRLRASIARGSAKAARSDGEENVLEIVCDCDRQALWTYSSLEGGKTLSRIDVAELSNALAGLRGSELAAAGVEGPCAMNGLPGLGGLPGTLRRLSAVYRFEPRVERAPEFKGVEVAKITGRARVPFWDESKRRLDVETFEPYLLENLPGNVEIYFGVDWPFPYRIVYFSLSEGEKPARKDIFKVEYTSVTRNDATIRPENFSYNQPQITFERVTSKYVDELTGERKGQ